MFYRDRSEVKVFDLLAADSGVPYDPQALPVVIPENIHEVRPEHNCGFKIT